MRLPKLHEWIVRSSSSALLVNFNNPKKTASASFICAKLAHTVQSEVIDPHYPRNMFALLFLCAEHNRSDDPDFGVSGMIQLLVAYPDFEMSIIKQIQLADHEDIDSLCQIFHMMIAQLPSHVTLFCILDAITVYEQGSLRSEGEYAVQELMEIVHWTRDNYGCVFKILLTSAWNSHAFFKCLPDQQKDVIWTPAKVPPRGGFTK